MCSALKQSPLLTAIDRWTLGYKTAAFKLVRNIEKLSHLLRRSHGLQKHVAVEHLAAAQQHPHRLRCTLALLRCALLVPVVHGLRVGNSSSSMITITAIGTAQAQQCWHLVPAPTFDSSYVEPPRMNTMASVGGLFL